MATLPAVPPPPPPAPPSSIGIIRGTPSSLKETQCDAAYPDCKTEVRRACTFLKNRLPEDTILLSHNRVVASILQEGPMCGLCALSMATEMTGKKVDVDLIFSTAKDRQFTKQGEMFSAADMMSLAEEITQEKCVLLDKSLQTCIVVSHLIKGNPVLVPYDSDCNHEPCLKEGRKAHWAVLTGVLFVMSDHQSSVQDQNYEQDDRLNYLYHSKGDYSDLSLEQLSNLNSNCDIYFFAKQGKSKHLQCWNSEDLRASNCNLTKIDPERDNEHYIRPEGGLEEGLKNKVVIIMKNCTAPS
ncbi:UPF0692 protein C19orf54 homolog [Lingula anatina]|uniref:Actin maturation protease n=1 Tax=Lingula anatina TaxID=7574 RepID=A0A1S3JL61_LINAN|nr:UPF0692 protein C19orf54 homolog [Lingula anatina]|eukprot:XP_013411107.1 UPF0692 protein C19orf54 homolog [Lingula anatina]